MLLVLIAWLPLLIIKGDKYKGTLKYRLGFWPDKIKKNFGGNTKWIWLHAVSVGEVAAVMPLVALLKKEHPQIKLLLSTVTKTGNQLAKQQLRQADEIIYFPFDLNFVTKKVIKLVNPVVFVVAETEIWPNFLKNLAQQSIPAIIVNGRISDKSYKHYLLGRFFMRRILSYIDCFSMQSAQDVERIKDIGALPQRVKLSGNLKFDRFLPEIDESQKNKLRLSLKIAPEASIFIAGSTHQGEDEIILSVYRQLLADYPNLVLIIASRHLERIPDIEKLTKQQGLSFVRKSKIEEFSACASVILLDTIGELSKLYSIGAIVFIGGSLVPVGGHNVLEPAAYGHPVLFGPHMSNFTYCEQLLKDAGAGITVNNVDELRKAAQKLLDDTAYREKLGEAAKLVVQQNRGSTKRTFNLIEKYLIDKS